MNLPFCVRCNRCVVLLLALSLSTSAQTTAPKTLRHKNVVNRSTAVSTEPVQQETELDAIFRAVQAGDPEAMYRIALLKLTGDARVSAIGYSGIDLLTRSAQSGYARGAVTLAAFYWDGRFVPKDQAKALSLYQGVADIDDAAAFEVGVIYKIGGEGIQKSPQLAAQWWQRAADHDDVQALVRLACLYRDGDVGFAKDLSKAYSLANKAADAGNAEALYVLATILYAGTPSVAKSPVTAYADAEKAAAMGFSAAYVLQGVICTEAADQVACKDGREGAKAALIKGGDAGISDGYVYLANSIARSRIPGSKEEAVGWLRKAAEQGNTSGEENLGVAYYMGFGTARDYTRARLWTERAANADSPLAELYMGNFYRDGTAEEKNAALAISWYQKAAAHGLDMAKYNLGEMYLAGSGVAADAAWGAALIKGAADDNLPIAEARVGDLYRSGTGLRKDPAAAFASYSKAATAGEIGGWKGVAACYQYGLGVKVDGNQAAKFYKAAAERGDVEAMRDLGFLYDLGVKGFKKNGFQAEYWYQQAIDHGDQQAKLFLDGKKVRDDNNRQAAENAGKLAGILLGHAIK